MQRGINNKLKIIYKFSIILFSMHIYPEVIVHIVLYPSFLLDISSMSLPIRYSINLIFEGSAILPYNVLILHFLHIWVASFGGELIL